MADLKHSINDESGTADSAGSNDPTTGWKPYTVASDSGIFYNSKQYDKGDTIELDELTAKNFSAAGDIKESVK